MATPASRRFWGAFLLLTVLIATTLIAGAALHVREQRALLARQAAERAIAQVEMVAAALRPLLTSGQLEPAHTAFRHVLQDHPSITSAIVANETGKVLLQNGTERPVQRMIELVPPPVRLVTRRLEHEGRPPALEVSLPLSLAENRDGTVRAEVRLHDLEPALLPLSLPYAGVGLVLLLLCAPAALVFGAQRLSTTARPATVRSLDVVPKTAVPADRRGEAGRSAAVEAARAKSAFLLNMSRELRGPAAHLLDRTRALAAALTGEPRQQAERLLAASEGLLTLTGKIHDYLSVEGGTFDDGDQLIDLHLLVADVVDTFVPIAHRAGVELLWWVDPEVPSLLHGPALRLREVLAKLAGNALRFTDRGEVCVTVSQAAGVQGRSVLLRFTVTDTGRGVEPSRRAHLFEPGADGTSGLGLLTCKQLVESMGGTLRYSEAALGGSTFAFTVPLRVAPRARETLPHDEGALCTERVMIVDDNATSRSVLERQLASWKIPHEAVASGREALTRLRAAIDYGAPYTLAIVDAVMPDTSGIDLVRSLRGDQRLAELPILLLTAGESLSLAETEALRISATLAKPVRPARLYTCLAAILLAHMKGTAPMPTAA